jgi:hypothetical protein
VGRGEDEGGLEEGGRGMSMYMDQPGLYGWPKKSGL